MCDGVKFQIKCNRVTAATVNVRLKDMPTVKNLGAPNDRMFPIHTYVGSVSNRSKFLVDFFVSPESLSFLDGSGFYVRVDTAVEFIHAVDSRGRFFFKP